MATNVSRETVRDALTTLLDAALVGAGKPVQTVYGYQVADFQGASPVVVVNSGPVERTRTSFGDCWHTVFTIYVHSFVLYSDEDTWTEDDAEDALDDIEVAIADAIASDTRFQYAEPSFTDGVEIGGVEYRHEVITFVTMSESTTW